MSEKIAKTWLIYVWRKFSEKRQTYFWRILFQSKKTLNTVYFRNNLPYYSTLLSSQLSSYMTIRTWTEFAVARAAECLKVCKFKYSGVLVEPWWRWYMHWSPKWIQKECLHASWPLTRCLNFLSSWFVMVCLILSHFLTVCPPVLLLSYSLVTLQFIFIVFFTFNLRNYLSSIDLACSGVTSSRIVEW